MKTIISLLAILLAINCFGFKHLVLVNGTKSFDIAYIKKLQRENKIKIIKMTDKCIIFKEFGYEGVFDSDIVKVEFTKYRNIITKTAKFKKGNKRAMAATALSIYFSFLEHLLKTRADIGSSDVNEILKYLKNDMGEDLLKEVMSGKRNLKTEASFRDAFVDLSIEWDKNKEQLIFKEKYTSR